MEKRIRSAEMKDAAAICGIYAPYITDNATSFETEVPDIATIQGRIRNIQAQHPWLVFEADNKVLGYAYGSIYRTRHAYQWCVEVSAYIDRAAHRSGVGRALYTALFEILRLQGYVNAYACITLPNAASVGLHEAVGFTHIGVFNRIGYKFGQWHDVVWLELRLQEPETPVPNPIPAREFLNTDRVLALFDQQAQTVRYGLGRQS
jgi:phosphinothricin acetyltransferase